MLRLLVALTILVASHISVLAEAPAAVLLRKSPVQLLRRSRKLSSETWL